MKPSEAINHNLQDWVRAPTRNVAIFGGQLPERDWTYTPVFRMLDDLCEACGWCEYDKALGLFTPCINVIMPDRNAVMTRIESWARCYRLPVIVPKRPEGMPKDKAGRACRNWVFEQNEIDYIVMIGQVPRAVSPVFLARARDIPMLRLRWVSGQ